MLHFTFFKFGEMFFFLIFFKYSIINHYLISYGSKLLTPIREIVYSLEHISVGQRKSV